MPPFQLSPSLLEAAAQPKVVAPSLDEGSVPDTAPPRRPSTQGEIIIDQKLRSGSPHLHPFFQTGPAVVPVTSAFGLKDNGGMLRASGGLSVARFNARRYSSADLFLHDVKASEILDEQEGRLGQGRQTSSAQLKPTLLVSTAPKSPSPLSGKPIIQEDECDETAVPALNAVVDFTSLRAPAYPESDSLCPGKVSAPVSPRTAPPMTVPSRWDGDAGAPNKGSSLRDCAVSSSASSVASNSPSDVSSDETADTEATSPERSPDGDETPIARVPVDLEKTFKKASREPLRGRRRTRASTGGDAADRYGTPEMPRGTAKLPHIPASAGLTPRMPGHHGHVKHLPRAEKLPLSGYELLASSISSAPAPSLAAPSRLSALVGSQRFASRRSSVASFMTTSTCSARSGPEDTDAGPGAEGQANLKPIYRRFEALNHRMLLHLQDELSELEEQLHRLDTTDTQTRRSQSRILPASRRAEHLAGGELQWHKTDILGKIGYKLGQYNHVLSSFASTRDLPAPSLSDVDEYRSYLATHQPITEVETRFLDTVDDLVTLAASKDKDKDSSPPPPPAAVSEQPPPPPPSAKITPATAQEYLDTFRMPGPPPPLQEDSVPPFPSVTPIPGTMHGNSWLMRHNRLSSMSERGHARTKSQPFDGPRFLNRRASMGCFAQHQQRQHQQMSNMPFPQPLKSSLKQEETLSPRTEPAKRPPVPTTEPKTSKQPPPSVQEVAVPVKSSVKNAHVLLHVVIAMAVAVLVPILAFSAVPGFMGRISVVLLVGLSAMGSMVQSGAVKKGVESSTDMMYIAGVYAAVMAVVAGVIN